MWIKIIFVFGLSLILYHFELISQYHLFDIMQTQPLYVQYYDFNLLCKYNNNFDTKWTLPLFNQTHNNTLTFDRIILNDSIINLESISVKSSPLFSKIIDNKYAIFCSSGYKPQGTGNALAIYWTARAMAFFMNLTFIFDINCKHKEYKMFDQIKYSQIKWTWFLNTQYNITFGDMCIDNMNTINKTAIALKYNYIWKYYANHQRRKSYNIPYRCYLMFLIYNPWFVNIIQSDTKNAFKRYYSHNRNNNQIPILFNQSQNNSDNISLNWVESRNSDINFYKSIMKELQNTNQYVILIHIRCGDILFHGARYLLNLKYFTTSLKTIFKHIQLKNDNLNKFYRFRIISQLSMTNVHTAKDVSALNMSNSVVYFMCAKIRNYIASVLKRNSYSFDIIGNGTADNDYFQMATTQYLICSPSSFCLNAAIANYYNPQLIILPKDGVWKKQIKTYVQIANNTKYGLLSHHLWLNTSKMYKQIKNIFKIDAKSNESSHNQMLFERGFHKFKQWFIGKDIANKKTTKKTAHINR